MGKPRAVENFPRIRDRAAGRRARTRHRTMYRFLSAVVNGGVLQVSLVPVATGMSAVASAAAESARSMTRLAASACEQEQR